MFISLVIPIKDEEENIPLLLEAIKRSLSKLEYEIILVDDGSTDNSVDTVIALTETYSNLILVEFNRNYGQSLAMAAGIDKAKGEIIATLDGDLQNDPSDIPMMIQILQEGNYDVVAGIRKKRQDGMFLRKIPSKIANMLIRKITGVHLQDYGCTLKIFRKDVAKSLGLYGELHRFIPVLATNYGAKITEVNVKHNPRVYGTSKYGIGRTTRVFSDLLFMIFIQKYHTRPMHLFGLLGVPSLLLGFGIEFYLLILKLLGESIGNRPLFMVGILLILIGMLMIVTGFLAEILMRTYYESQNKKPFVIKRIIGEQNTH